MKGTTFINVNTSTVIAALQLYFDRVVYKRGAAPTVDHVGQDPEDAERFKITATYEDD